MKWMDQHKYVHHDNLVWNEWNLRIEWEDICLGLLIVVFGGFIGKLCIDKWIGFLREWTIVLNDGIIILFVFDFMSIETGINSSNTWGFNRWTVMLLSIPTIEHAVDFRAPSHLLSMEYSHIFNKEKNNEREWEREEEISFFVTAGKARTCIQGQSTYFALFFFLFFIWEKKRESSELEGYVQIQRHFFSFHRWKYDNSRLFTQLSSYPCSI